MFKIYSSSAGSGKTYTLTKEYIKLALNESNDSYYRHILAVTFTNAAAQEMKERILQVLRLFSEGATHPMLNDITLELYPEIAGNPELQREKSVEISKRASRIFTRILHGYADFSVMTIDSFMSRLVASFTDELGLPFGFETRLDGDLLAEAIDKLLARIGISGEETLTAVVEKYYLEHAKSEGAWGALPRHMLNAAGDLLNEQSYLSMTRVSDLTLSDWQRIRVQLLAFIKEKEDQIAGLATAAFQEIEKSGLAAADFSQSTRGIYGYFAGRSQAKRQKTWEPPNSYVVKTIDEGKWTAGKVSPASAAAIAEISGLLTDAYYEIETIRAEFGGLAALYKAVSGQLFGLSLLNEIKREFDLLLRQNNQVHISEFNRKIIEIVANDPVPFIFERLGEKYHHILIDEFQDTSRLQFANLLPLIENALSYGHFNLIVGDVKQAIYRFRGGDMELLLKLSGNQALQISQLFDGSGAFMEDRLHLIDRHTELTRLTVNRRSFREITTFNNEFFEFLVQNSGQTLGKEVYDAHFQQSFVPETPTGGHLQIDFFDEENPEDDAAHESEDPEPEEEAAPDSRGRAVIARVRELLNEGYTLRDIAILCRYKKNATTLAVWLQKAGIPLISDDSLLLGNSRYVGLVIAILKVMLNPGSVNLKLETALLLLEIHSTTSPGGMELDEIAAISRSEDIDEFYNWLAGFGMRFDAAPDSQPGLYELCEQIIARLNLAADPLEYPYVFRFLDEVLQFEANRVSHTGDFLNWWELTGKTRSISASNEINAVRITTIHKSKGLEYPVVIIPYAEWKATPKPGTRLWVNLDQVEAPELVSTDQEIFSGNYRPVPARLTTAAVPMSKSLEETPVGSQYRDELERVLIENINLTYVAFTRPIERLYLLATLPKAPKSTSSGPPAALHFWLQEFLTEKGLWKSEQLSYVLYNGILPKGRNRSEVGAAPVAIRSPFGSGDVASVLVKRNHLFEAGMKDSNQDFGRKVRQTLTKLPSYERIKETIAREIQLGSVRRSEASQIGEKIKEVMLHPEISKAYAPDARRLPAEIIRRGGDLIESDLLVRTKDNQHIVVLFAENKSANQDRMRRLIADCRACGLENVSGILADIYAEPVNALTFP